MSSEESSDDVNLLEEGKQTILDLINAIDQIMDFDEVEQGEFVLVKIFFTRLNEETIMKQIVTKILPHKNQIVNRNENFFLNHETLFSSLPGNRIKHYRKMLTSDKRLDDDDRDVIWQYFDTLLWIGEEYKKNI